MRGIHRAGGVLTGLALLLIAGCGGDDAGGRMAISGTVLYKGQPIQSGSIEFVPHQGVKTHSGSMVTNGRFSIPADKGLDPGNYTIKISSIEAPPPSEPGGLPGPDPKELIPAKYNTNSTLTREVKKGESSFEFKLD